MNAPHTTSNLAAPAPELAARHAATSLRNRLRMNTGFSLTTGVLGLVFAEPIADFFAIDQSWLVRALGAALVGFAFVVLAISGTTTKTLTKWGLGISIADFGWVIGTAVVIGLGWLPTGGAVIMATVAAVVFGLGVAQLRARRRTLDALGTVRPKPSARKSTDRRVEHFTTLTADRDRWNRNIHYHDLLVELGPASSALDVGCGGGLLTRQLASVCESVVGIDPHEASILGARSETSERSVSYVVADVLDHPFEPGSFDLIVSVAALHHMDAEAGLRRMADLLAPGGRLGIVGIGRSSYPRDLLRDALAGVATQIHKRARRVHVWDHTAPIVWPPPLTDHQMKKLATNVLPGSEFKRRIHGRHTIVWTKQDSSTTF